MRRQNGYARAAGMVVLVVAGVLAGAGFCDAAAPFKPAIAKQADGDWQVSAGAYSATIGKAGFITSLKVGTVETLAGFTYQKQAELAADTIEPAGDAVKVHLKGKGDVQATIEYRFRPDGVTIVPTWRGGGYAEFSLAASPALLGIELLNDKSVTGGGDAVRFVEHGEVRGVPAVPSSRNQMVRFHFPRFAVRAYVQAWGAPFNYESAGSIRERTWGRPLLEANKAFPIVLTIEKSAGKAALPAVPFVARSGKVCSLYYEGEPCTWTLDLGEPKAYAYLTDAGIAALDVSWRLTDIDDRPAGEGKARIALDPKAQRLAPEVRLDVPRTGYYQALVTLSEPSGRMLPSSVLTRLTVIHKVPGMVNRDDALAGKNLTDYAVVAMIGIGGIRESHNIGGFFSAERKEGPEWEPVPGAEPAVWMNVKRLDELFTQADAEARKYGLTWFFQANSRPKYATPAVYEAMAAALVGRYKDRCRTWEVENEPNFGYTPEKYMAECVIPFAKGAKRADPGCAILGPGGCGVRDTLRFMEAIYAAGEGKWFDQISTHTYPGPGEAWGRFGNLAMLGQLRAWMKEHGDAAKPVWQTEQGYNWELNPKGQAARYAARQFLQGWRMGIEPARQYYFYPQAHGFESWYQSGGGEAGSEHSWLPVAAAQRFVAENTLGRTYAGDVPAPYKGVYLPRFTGEAGDVVAAWTFDFAVDLKVRAKGLRRVVGYMGNTLDARPAADGTLVLPLSGEPLYVHLEKGGAMEVLTAPFGPNLAAQDAGGTAASSSADSKHPAALANDGNWELWEDAPGLPGRTSWMSDRMDPTPKEPDWLEVTFAAPRKVSRLVMLGYLPAVNPSPRDFEFQVREGGRWRTVASGKDEATWVLAREFPPAMATAVRMVVTRINDGWQGDRRWMHVLMGPDAKNYTASKLMVAELEAYGPEQAAGAGVK